MHFDFFKKLFLISAKILFLQQYLFADSTFNQEFIESFVKHYEFNVEGRYAHEYHPALLNKTSRSLDDLESQLIQNGFNLAGRLVICGYEENAVPKYRTDYKKSKINDEASSKSNVGWSVKLHNCFGFMTGFIFKDVNYFSANWFANNSIFQHIDSEEIELFDDRAEIFQEHALGQALDLIFKAQKNVIKEFRDKNFKGIFEELIKFWNCLYKGEIKVGNMQIAGTQDILFSIEYARHLIRSQLPLFNFYVGPDITYPIEVSVAQGIDATLHAQNFVRVFSQRLKAVKNKPTVYVFCSFVDGVGKSTMLGNIKNFRRHAENVSEYERVDNSSSQLAEIFKLDDNVFIADLPAQVSHFTYKPDGFVYVSVGRELDKIEVENLQKFVRENKVILQQNYELLLADVKNIIDTQEYFVPVLNDSQKPEKAFIRNLFLTKKEKSNRWVPFCFENKNYLFNLDNPFQIRVLVKLGVVQSEGLKNIEAEQMLFLEGIRFPAPYNFFLNNFLEKLKQNGIEEIVFVDFISMYPRSSRENIRLNYLLQQMALLDENFDSKYSLYKDFVSGAELLSILKNSKFFDNIAHSFELEVLTRLALFNVLAENTKQELKNIRIDELTNLLKLEISKTLNGDISFFKDLIFKKLNIETSKLEEIYGFTKKFINIQQFNFFDVVRFSYYLSDFFCHNVDNYNLNILWQDVGKIIGHDTNDINVFLDKILLTDKAVHVRAFYCFSPECKDERVISPFLRTLRASWYAAIFNLARATELNNNFCVAEELFFVPSFFVDIGKNSNIYLFQRIFDEWQEKVPLKNKRMVQFFNLSNIEKAKWGKFNDNSYLLDWKSDFTNKKLFAFDCDTSAKSVSGKNKTISTFLVQKYQKTVGVDRVISTSKFYENLIKSNLWRYEWNNMFWQARENNSKKQKAIGDKKNDQKEEADVKVNKKDQTHKIFLGEEEQKPVFRMIVRLLATLEMVLKDPESEIVLRFGNREDFIAAVKLFEKITLPKYFGILFEKDLFDNYEDVEPYPSWRDWEFKEEKE